MDLRFRIIASTESINNKSEHRGEKKLNYILELIDIFSNVIKLLNVKTQKWTFSKVIIQMVSIQNYILMRLITSIVVTVLIQYNIYFNKRQYNNIT